MSLLAFQAKDSTTQMLPRAKGGEIPLVAAKNAEYSPQGLVMHISTEGGAEVTSKTVYSNCHYRMVDKDGRVLFDTTTTGAWARVRGRGNTTWDLPKKPWKVKLTNTAKMLTFPTSKDWALLANYTDQVRIKNAVAYELFRRTGQAWTPRSFFVEVYFNGRYDGLYQMIESVEVDPNRNNITKIGSADKTGRNLTGGYCWEIEGRPGDTDVAWRTRLGQNLIADTPDLTVAEQLAYSKTTLQTLEDRLFADNFTDATLGYRPLIDMDTWIDWYLTTELIGSIDSGWGASIRISKDRDAADGTVGKIKLGPPWDYDRTFGADLWSPTEWIVRLGAFPIARMMEDPAFMTRLGERWATLKAAWTAPGNHINSWASALYTSLSAQMTRDNARWGTYVQPITQITDWITSRLAWMDGQITGAHDTTPPAAPTGCVKGALVAGGRMISWDSAGDPNAGADVVGYRVKMDGVIAGITTYNSDRQLANEVAIANATGSVFTVQCRDRYGNWSTETTAT